MSMNLDDRLKALLTPLGAVNKRMFGGTCFMIDGNMAIGTLKDGLIVRVGKDGHAAALKRPGARVFDMTGRPSEGFISVDGKSVASAAALNGWVEIAVAFAKSLPPKAAKPAKVAARKKRRPPPSV
jgi:TfoX/Sxy family transcriptional regulator of competence genes